jgi:hypothetical protein
MAKAREKETRSFKLAIHMRAWPPGVPLSWRPPDTTPGVVIVPPPPEELEAAQERWIEAMDWLVTLGMRRDLDEERGSADDSARARALARPRRRRP